MYFRAYSILCPIIRRLLNYVLPETANEMEKTMKHTRGLSLIVLIAAVLTGLVRPMRAQEQPVAPPEKNIYIPYQRLWETFEKDNRGIFLPYAEFTALWQKAYPPETVKPPLPPLDSSLSTVHGKLQIGEDSASGSMSLQFNLHRQGWLLLPLQLADCAISDFQSSQPAQLIFEPQKGYAVLLQNSTPQPPPLQITLQFSCMLKKAPGLHILDFAAPPCPINAWEAVIPQPNLKINVADDGTVKRELPGDDQHTRVTLQLGSNARLYLAWTPKSEGAKGLPPVIYADSTQKILLENGLLRSQSLCRLEVSRSPLPQLELLLPADCRITQVYSENIRQWKTAPGSSGTQQLKLEFHEPLLGQQSFSLEMEKPYEPGTTELPCWQVPEALRQTGRVGIFVGEAQKAEVQERLGLTEIAALATDFQETSLPITAAFRFATAPWKLSCRVENLQAALEAESASIFFITPGDLIYHLNCQIKTGPVGIFQTFISLPADLKLDSCQVSSGPDSGNCLKEHFLAEEQSGRRVLRLSLNRQCKDLHISLRLSKPLRHPELLTPGLPPVSLPLSLAHLQDDNVQSESGRIAVCAHSSLRLTQGSSSSLHETMLSELSLKGLPKDILPVLAYRYLSTSPLPQLTLQADRRAAQTTVSQLQTVALLSGNLLTMKTDLQIEVLYSGRKHLPLTMTAGLAQRLKILTRGYRLVPDEGSDSKPGWENFILQGEKEFLGRQQVILEWSEELGELPPGESRQINCQQIMPRQVDRSWGQIVLMKSEMTDLRVAESQNLIPIDPRFDLRDGLNLPNAATAYSFHGDWQLSLLVTRYQNVPVKSTSIERGLVRMVRTKNGQTSVQACYLLRSLQQRLELRLPLQAQFDNAPVRLGNQPVPLERGEEQQYFVPLVSHRQGELMLLELRYLLPESIRDFPVPLFPADTALQQVYLSVHLPDDRAVIGRTGPWNDENVWVVRGLFNVYPRARMADEQLLNWLCADSLQNFPREHLSSFVTAGRPILFSALHPQDDKGTATMVIRTAPVWLVKTLPLLLILGLGLLLCRAALRQKLLAIGAGLSVLGALAVFQPWLTYALLSNASALAAFIVAIVWLLFRRRGCQPCSAPKPDNPPDAPPPPTPAPEQPTV